jgi:branched-chain amino acid transport system substrate-binding protein
MKFSRILMALTVFSLLLAACVPAATPTPTQAPAAPAASPTPAAPAATPTPAVKGTIKIATQSPLSGGQAALGEGIKNGAQLAIEQLKGPIEALGFKVELVPFDDQAKPDVGVANAKQLVNDPDILAVIGHLNSGVAIPSSETYKDYDLVMVSPANTNPCITDRGYLVVNRVCGRDDVQGAVGAEFAFNELKVKTAFVIHDKTTYGQGVAEFFKKRFEELGGKVLGFEGTEEKANFDPLITAIQAANPELIYFGGIYDQAGVFFKQAREKGVKADLPGAGRDGLLGAGQDRRRCGGGDALHDRGRAADGLRGGQEVHSGLQGEVRQGSRALLGPGLRRHGDRAEGHRGGHQGSGRPEAEPQGGGGEGAGDQGLPGDHRRDHLR